jgi:hypothetical protein
VHTHAASETFYVLTGRGAVDLARARPVRVVDRIAACPLVRLCSLINTSNTAPTAPQLKAMCRRVLDRGHFVWCSLLAADPCNGHSGPSDRTPIALAKCLR